MVLIIPIAAELVRATRDTAGALTRYKWQVKPRIVRKQGAGRRLARWFVSDNQVRVVMRDMVLRLVAWSMILRVLNCLADLLQGLTRWQ